MQGDGPPARADGRERYPDDYTPGALVQDHHQARQQHMRAKLERSEASYLQKHNQRKTSILKHERERITH